VLSHIAGAEASVGTTAGVGLWRTSRHLHGDDRRWPQMLRVTHCRLREYGTTLLSMPVREPCRGSSRDPVRSVCCRTRSRTVASRRAIAVPSVGRAPSWPGAGQFDGSWSSGAGVCGLGRSSPAVRELIPGKVLHLWPTQTTEDTYVCPQTTGCKVATALDRSLIYTNNCLEL